ncbi:hypothetical protein HDE_12818 [Halotydeus destructor]|nr:hypothetical protein HDE_12818 [Halotydeus destructor]
MKTMRYVDLRVPRDPYLDDEGMVENGIREFLMTRVGRQLIELKLAKEHARSIPNDVLEKLQLLPKTTKKLLTEDEKGKLAALLTRLANDGKLVKKHQSLIITGELAKRLVDAVYKHDGSITDFKQDSSAVKRLNISL